MNRPEVPHYASHASSLGLALEIWPFEHVSNEWRMHALVARPHADDSRVRDCPNTLRPDDRNSAQGGRRTEKNVALAQAEMRPSLPNLGRIQVVAAFQNGRTAFKS